MFNIVTIIVFILLGIIWKKGDWINLAIKVGFFALAVWGLVATNVLTLTL